MNPVVAPHLPYRPTEARLVIRGRLTLRVRAGEHHAAVPSLADIRRRGFVAAGGLDGGPIDSALRQRSAAVQVGRLFDPAQRTLAGATGWDDIERELGLDRTFQVDLDPTSSLPDTLAALRDLDVVEVASACFLCQAPFGWGGAGRGDPSVFDRVGATRALMMEPGDSALIVGVVDSGVSRQHPELIRALRPGADVVDLDAERLSRGLKLMGDTSARDREPDDDVGHGTATMSIIGARGLHVHPGIGGAARLLPLRAMARALREGARDATAVGSLADIDTAVKLAVDLGARVLNLSFGTPASALGPDDPIPHEAVVRYAAARGCVLVAASGNSGLEERYYPAALPEVLAVGAVDGMARPSSFTTRGEHVLLCAPGERIPTAGIEGYQECSGTSFAAPFVAGAVALLLARANRNSTPVTPEEIRHLLATTASPFPTDTTAQGCGSGVLDLPAALRALDEATPGARPPPPLAPLWPTPAAPL